VIRKVQLDHSDVYYFALREEKLCILNAVSVNKISWFILNPSVITLCVNGAGVFISAWFEMLLWLPYMHYKDLLKKEFNPQISEWDLDT